MDQNGRTLTVSDMIVFKGPYAYSLTSTGQEEQAYLGFTTSDGDAAENLERQLRPISMCSLVTAGNEVMRPIYA